MELIKQCNADIDRVEKQVQFKRGRTGNGLGRGIACSGRKYGLSGRI